MSPHSKSLSIIKPQSSPSPSIPVLHSSFYNNRGNDDENIDPKEAKEAMERNKKRTCIHHFLTQRSIQSFMFLAEQVRDPHTADWIERFLETSDLLNYHGTGAFNMTRFPIWDDFFYDLMQQPKATIIIQAKRRGRGRGGWSKNNPYLKNRFVEYEVDVDPEGLVPRIMSVREQIASEFVDDLDLVRTANDQILGSYEKKVFEEGTFKKAAFDREAYNMLVSNMQMEPIKSSPIRKGSFDLLQLLSLQESIHRTLRHYKDLGTNKEVSFQWFRQFYIDRLQSHFDGYVYYHRADDFIEELLLSTPSVKSDERHMDLIDPLSITSDIIRLRSEVLLEWKDDMSRVPDYHIGLRKAILTRQMEGMSSSKSLPIQDGYGAFE